MQYVGRLLSVFVVLFSALASADERPFDLLITNAHVVDGSGSPWYQADVAVRGQTIAAIGHFPRAKARQRIDAHGRIAVSYTHLTLPTILRV